ncbi:MAG: hypothetical protein IPO21_00465 [Bacteroidales bacterium]|nr:hypothetical protein [Bacteroidales bacterium]
MTGFTTAHETFSLIFWLIVILLVIFKYSGTSENSLESDKYYRWGLGLKIVGALFFNLIYLYYYGGGDTFYYYWGAGSIYNMAFKDFGAFIQLMIGERSPELFSLFDYTTGYPTYYKDVNAFSVCRFMVPFYILGFTSFWGTTLAMNLFMFSIIWAFFKMLNSLYPGNEKRFALFLFFIPSLFVWSSGILKDIWCLYSIFMLFVVAWKIQIKKEKIFRNILLFLLWSYILISIRPFMYYTALTSILLWVVMNRLKKLDNSLLRVFIFPFFLLIAIGLSTLLITKLSFIAGGKFATIDSMLEHAVIIQDDLSRDYYGENSFDIGAFEPTIGGMLSKAPQALIAGFFRPFIWESRSALILLSGLENLFLLVSIIVLLVKTKFIWFFVKILEEPFILAAFTFCILFGFMVGLTTANFGALVRYKIPIIPFLGIVYSYIWGKLAEEKQTTII